MNLKCYAENCLNKLKFYCSCKKNYVFSCSEHINQHADEGEKSQHCIKAMYQKFNSNKKTFLIDTYQRISETLLNTQSSIIISINSLSQALAEFKIKTEKFFREQRVEIEKIIDSLKIKDRELIVPELIEINSFLYEEMQTYYELLSPKFESLCKNTIKDTSNFSEFYKNYNEFYDDNIFDYKGNANLDKNLYFFKTGTRLFVEFNVNTLSSTEFEANVNEAQGSLAVVCQLPGYKIFHVGGYQPHLSTGYIIDLNNHTVETLQNVRARSITSATYFENEVYIFTGHHINENLVYCDKFSLATKTWSSLANFPSGAVYSISALPCREYFILSTLSENKLYKYDTKKNSYGILTSSVVNHAYNTLFRDNENYYYLSNNLCFISNEENLGIWVKNSKYLSESLHYITTKPVSRNRNVYFLSSYSKVIFKFNLETEELFKVLTYN